MKKFLRGTVLLLCLALLLGCARGVAETEQIRGLDAILKEIEDANPPPRSPTVYAVRDPEAYYVSIFGPLATRTRGDGVSKGTTSL